jgi:hypothetical protein
MRFNKWLKNDKPPAFPFNVSFGRQLFIRDFNRHLTEKLGLVESDDAGIRSIRVQDQLAGLPYPSFNCQ